MRLLSLAWISGLLLSGAAATAAEPAWQAQAYAPAPADNPLKGLVPYAGATNPDGFPYSMEFSYLPLSAVLTGPDRYDFGALERLLDAVAKRGHQTVVRFYLEYPDKKDGIPQFLLDKGLKTTRYARASTPPRPPAVVETPDYNNAELRQTLVKFIAAFGERYDGDVRLGFITAGLLGLWGEWHDSPHNELFASKTVQAEVMAAYTAAFHRTHILLRYPAGDADDMYAPNAHSSFGYHDDSFAWGTLGSSSWHFMKRMRGAGDEALNRWKTRPIGGEIRPEAWGKVFDVDPGNKNIEDFRQCVEATHVSWLMDSGMFKSTSPEQRRLRAIEEVRHMGYEFHVAKVALSVDSMLHVAFMLENRGVAPFYYPWQLEFGLLDDTGRLARRMQSPRTLSNILPGDAPALAEHAFDIAGLVPGHYRVLLRVPNPLPGGQAVRFANVRQDADLPDWLTLGEADLR